MPTLIRHSCPRFEWSQRWVVINQCCRPLIWAQWHQNGGSWSASVEHLADIEWLCFHWFYDNVWMNGGSSYFCWHKHLVSMKKGTATNASQFLLIFWRSIGVSVHCKDGQKSIFTQCSTTLLLCLKAWPYCCISKCNYSINVAFMVHHQGLQTKSLCLVLSPIKCDL